ncbi:MAG: hypothetical protein PHQ14_14350 [Chromatiales bacterium]|jgi:hypothetical protein|nr:hypothetical protein [Chromatiales bacterium]MDX9766637.1 hypothetical protein [Ectothiorhodospiraceae bacterium]
MMISSTAFGLLVGIAVLVATLSPLVLIVLFIRDQRRGTLW